MIMLYLNAVCHELSLVLLIIHDYLEVAKIQGFTWNQSTYKFSHGIGEPKTQVDMKLGESTYLVLAMRYKELFIVSAVCQCHTLLFNRY
jgi:hypothetical protein